MKVEMKKKSASQSAFFDPRVLLCMAIFFIGLLLTLLATANPQDLVRERERQLTPKVNGASRAQSALIDGVQEAWVAGHNESGNA